MNGRLALRSPPLPFPLLEGLANRAVKPVLLGLDTIFPSDPLVYPLTQLSCPGCAFILCSSVNDRESPHVPRSPTASTHSSTQPSKNTFRHWLTRSEESRSRFLDSAAMRSSSSPIRSSNASRWLPRATRRDTSNPPMIATRAAVD